MTRREFIENVVDFDDLLRFCDDNSCWEMESVRRGDDFDEYVRDSIYNWDDSWESLRDWLDILPSVNGYTFVDVDRDYMVLGPDDFEEYKDDVLSWGDRNDEWDEDDEVEEADSEESDGTVYLFEGPAPEPEKDDSLLMVYDMLMA